LPEVICSEAYQRLEKYMNPQGPRIVISCYFQQWNHVWPLSVMFDSLGFKVCRRCCRCFCCRFQSFDLSSDYRFKPTTIMNQFLLQHGHISWFHPVLTCFNHHSILCRLYGSFLP
jgi:hypothetical protein